MAKLCTILDECCSTSAPVRNLISVVQQLPVFGKCLAKGPIILKPENNGGSLESMWDRPFGSPFWKLNEEWADKVDEDWEVCPMFIGEQSPVKVDHSMQTTIPGLYAIGDASYCGSAAPGAVPAPPGRNRGSGILNAVFSGIVCAQSAAENANNNSLPPIDKTQVEDCMTRAYALVTGVRL